MGWVYHLLHKLAASNAMQRYMWRYLAVTVALCLVASVAYLDVQARYRTSELPDEEWTSELNGYRTSELNGEEWNGSVGRRTLMQDRDWWRDADDQWSADESVSELFETEER